jgi:glycosyltransferase involved in cell wall biosynthesis
VPEAHLTVIGKRPPKQVSELAAQPNVDVLGYVADPAPYLAETAAFIVPLHAGAGMRVKILDAWCWGVPVVSTTHGAEGIEATHGEQLLLADDAPSFAEAVARLLTDGDLRTRLIRGGRRRVAERFDWRTRYTAWDEIYPGNDVG